MNSATYAQERLMSWPWLAGGGPAVCGAEGCVRADGREIVHFHGAHEADVHLTRSMIARLETALSHSHALRLSEGSGWVSVHLDTLTDADLLVTLVSAALRAAGEDPDAFHAADDPCTAA